MIEVLNHIEDIKKIRELLLEGKVKEAVKESQRQVPHKIKDKVELMLQANDEQK